MCNLSNFRSLIFYLLALFFSTNSVEIEAKRTSPVRRKLNNNRNITIIDLSKDLEDAPHINSNPGAKMLLDGVTSSTPLIRGYVVLEHGKKVAEYIRDDLTVDTIYPVYSATKCWTGLIIGMIIDQGKLRLNDTLSDIWTDDASWTDVTNADVKKNTTIESLLTMTSGLVDNPAVYATIETLDDIYDMAGTTLAEVLNFALFAGVDQIGKFNYFASGNILGYVIKERTGLSPDDYASKYIMPHIGIADGRYDWWSNSDGVANTFFGLEMTPRQLAKFGQIYLQDGFANETFRMVSRRWIASSFEAKVDSSSYSMINSFYGYLWWEFPFIGATCGVGLGGQVVCVWPEDDRVFTALTEYDNMDDYTDVAMGLAALVSQSSFQPVVDDATTTPESSESSASTDSISKGSVVKIGPTVMFLISSMLLIGLNWM